MVLVATNYEHIALNEANIVFIKGTNMKVVELVSTYLSSDSSPEEIQSQHPYLSLGQIYSALAYYWDHKEALDKDIQQRLAKADKLQQQTPVPAFVNRIKKTVR